MQDLFLIGSLPWWVIALVTGSVALLVQPLFAQQRLSLGQSSFLVFPPAFMACLFSVRSGLGGKRRQVASTAHGSGGQLAKHVFPALTPNRRKTGNPQKAGSISSEKLLAGKEPLIQELSRDYDLRLYRFGTALEPIAPASIATESSRSRDAAFGSASPPRGKPGNSPAFFSDGIANGEEDLEEISPSVPIFTIGGRYRGLHRRSHRRSPLRSSFPRTRVETRFDGSGLRSQRQDIPLYFNRGKPDHQPFYQNGCLSKKSPSALRQKEIGTHSFSLAIPNQPGEQITQNNHKDLKIDVQRDKIRVIIRLSRLELSISAHGDETGPFDRSVSFVFLRTPTDSVDVPENQLSLIPFPIDDIFGGVEEFRRGRL